MFSSWSTPGHVPQGADVGEEGKEPPRVAAASPDSSLRELHLQLVAIHSAALEPEQRNRERDIINRNKHREELEIKAALNKH